MNKIKDLIVSTCLSQKATTIKLYNKNHIPIGAIHLNQTVDYVNNLLICETASVDEKYCLFLNGVSVFFTYYSIV